MHSVFFFTCLGVKKNIFDNLAFLRIWFCLWRLGGGRAIDFKSFPYGCFTGKMVTIGHVVFKKEHTRKLHRESGSFLCLLVPL